MPSPSRDDALARKLREARSEAESLREQLLYREAAQRQLMRLLEVGRETDLDRIAAAALEIPISLLAVDAALLLVGRPGKEPFTLSRGLPPADERRLVGLLAGEPLVDPHPVQLPRLDEVHGKGGRGFEEGYAAPLTASVGGALAVLCHDAHPARARLVDELGELALVAGAAIANERVYHELRDAAARDPLTGLYNRGIFHEELARASTSAGRYRWRLALCVLDVDDFKQVNTELGHLDGDAILREIGESVARSVRAADVAGRIGGDEFAVLLPHSNVWDAVRLYQRIAAAVADATRSLAWPIAVSAGIAQLRAGEEPESVFRRADHSLQVAKVAGKACYVVAEGDDGVLTDGSSGLAERS